MVKDQKELRAKIQYATPLPQGSKIVGSQNYTIQAENSQSEKKLKAPVKSLTRSTYNKTYPICIPD